MNDASEPTDNRPPHTNGQSPTPDDLVHMYGGFLFFVAVPVVLVLIVIYLLFIR